MKKTMKRKESITILISILCVLFIFSMTGCSKNGVVGGEKPKSQVESGSSIKVEGTQMPVRYAKGFSITYLKDGIKKVVDGEKRTLLLIPRGKEVPTEYKKENIVYTPIEKVLIGSTTEASLLRPIKELGSISTVIIPKDQWEISEVKMGLENGKTNFVGESAAPDYEKISATKPQMAFLYTGPSGLQPMMAKFNELNIKYAVVNDYLEEDPLGRLEWIKFMSAFYNKEEEAEKYFTAAEKVIKEVQGKVKESKKPKVVWGSVYKGEVYVPRLDSYAAKMIELAGGEYVFKYKGVGSEKISLEQFYAAGKEADLFMYPSSKTWSPTLQSIVEQAPVLSKLKVVENKNVWCFHPDYWQSSDKTDEMVTDLAQIFHPELYPKSDIKHFLKYDK